MKRWIIRILRWYQATACLRLPVCRFYPTCSSYMIKAIERHGLGRGLTLGALRLMRCHPLNPGGIDQVPLDFDLPVKAAGTS